MITLVVRDRLPILGTLGTDVKNPSIELSDTGRIVAEEWEKTVLIQQAHERKIRLIAQSVMPDHWHGVIAVDEPMDKSLGAIVQATKSAITARWWRLSGVELSPSSADRIRTMSTFRREEYYSCNKGAAPLFDANYDDSIALREGQEEAMIHYVLDNPRRAILRRAYPQLFEKRLHIEIAGQDYAAYGNLFLLKWGWKVPVKCHRWRMVGNQRDYNTHYEQSAEFASQLDELKRQAAGGALLVTPAISKGEQIVRNMCLDQHIPLILLQKEPIEPYWKPEQRRFDACAEGLLLILAPWQLENLGTATRTYADGTTEEIPADTDYSRFHNMNNLAIELSRYTGEAKIKR